MDIDFEKEWGITAVTRDLFLNDINPRAIGSSFIINSKYFLKTNPASMYNLRIKENGLILKLQEQNIPVLLPLREKVVKKQDKIYMLFPYLRDHRNNTFSDEDIKQIAGLLSALSNVDYARLDEPKLSIKEEIETLTESMLSQCKDPGQEYHKALLHVKENLFPFIPFFNKTFSHGDFHPYNLLWDKDKIAAIIDWEIPGIREELYDLAFLIGCFGIENPDDMSGKKTEVLLKEFAEKFRPSKLSFTLLPELVLSSRMKWLYKWIVIGEDEEIIAMENKLLSMLVENIEDYRKKWILSAETDFLYSKEKWVLQDSFMTEEINKAKERNSGKDIFDIDTFEDPAQYATDLRLLAIDFGEKNDIIRVLKILDTLEKLHKKYSDNRQILQELVFALGNSTLDFSRLRLYDAIEKNREEIEKIIFKNPDIDELKIGKAFALRNSSIAYGEAKQFEKSNEAIVELDVLSQNTDIIEIKGEFARALSNGITTILANCLDDEQRINDYMEKLEVLNQKYKTRKVDGAYKVAKMNIKKANKQIE